MKRHHAESRRGLTLLELLVVVFIMAAIAGAAVSLTDTIDQQSRYDDTLSRLSNLRYAAIGDTRPGPDGRRVMSGFVADLGRLPTTVDELVSPAPVSTDPVLGLLTGNYRMFLNRTPIFDPTPDVDGLSNFSGDEIEIGGMQVVLMKGFRGPYIHVSAGASFYRDAWGNVDPTFDALNHGWRLSPPLPLVGMPANTSIVFKSLGADGVDGQSSASDLYTADILDVIVNEDWTVRSTEVSATLINRSAMLTASTEGGATVDGISIALLVYQDGRWRRFESATTRLPVWSTGGDTSLPPPIPLQDDGTNRVPMGRHVFVVLKDGAPLTFSTTDPKVYFLSTVDVLPRTTPVPPQIIIQ